MKNLILVIAILFVLASCASVDKSKYLCSEQDYSFYRCVEDA